MSDDYIICIQPPPTVQGMTEAELLAIFHEQPASNDAMSAAFIAPVELIRMYLQQTPVRIWEMRGALASGDLPLLARAAHTLKGNSTYVGADGIGRLGAEIERRVDAGELAGVNLLIAELETEFDGLQVGLLAGIEDNV